jgi:hypothetical protein
MVKKIWGSAEERKAVWHERLRSIQADTDRIPDRLLRLNVKTQRQLSELLTGEPENVIKYLATRLNGDESVHVPTYEEHYLKKISLLRDSLSARSFIEW